MKANTTGGFNTAIGDDAQLANTTGSYNVSNGNGTLNSANGDSNTAIGYRAGYTNATGSNNVFIGHKAGYNETGSNKLYISNGDTSSPLIQGDFSSGEVTINGNLTVNTLKDSSGNSMVRKVGDVVHIGKNSFTVEDSSTSSSGKDEIASSINELQIGTSTSHNTTINGTLTIQAPTTDNHATTKSYVDTATNTNNTNINNNTSAINLHTTDILNNSNNIQNNTDLINTNTADISLNKNGISQIAAMSGLTSAQNGKSHISVASGNFNGQSAIALGISHHDDKADIIYQFKGSSSGNTSSSVFSIGWGF
jgi:translation elongation factor P/translation initiation factor 5A